MKKSEQTYNLLELCSTPIGNQLHSRITAAAIAMCIDDVHTRNLFLFLLSDNCEEFMMISDELTDYSGVKSLILKFRFFEGWELREFLISIVESTGTSEEMCQKFVNDFIEQFEKATGFSEEAIKSFFEESKCEENTNFH